MKLAIVTLFFTNLGSASLVQASVLIASITESQICFKWIILEKSHHHLLVMRVRQTDRCLVFDSEKLHKLCRGSLSAIFGYIRIASY